MSASSRLRKSIVGASKNGPACQVPRCSLMPTARDAEGLDARGIGHCRQIVGGERRRHGQQPLPLAHRGEALRDADMARDPVEGEAARAEPHDVEPRRAVAQHQLRIARPERRAVVAGRDHLTEGREGFGRKWSLDEWQFLGSWAVSLKSEIDAAWVRLAELGSSRPQRRHARHYKHTGARKNEPEAGRAHFMIAKTASIHHNSVCLLLLLIVIPFAETNLLGEVAGDRSRLHQGGCNERWARGDCLVKT